MRCDVHYYINGDSEDRDVFFCENCNAWICGKCRDKTVKRFFAMLVKFFKNER